MLAYLLLQKPLHVRTHVSSLCPGLTRQSKRAGGTAHTPSADLPAYLLPQEPFLSALRSVLAPPIGECKPVLAHAPVKCSSVGDECSCDTFPEPYIVTRRNSRTVSALWLSTADPRSKVAWQCRRCQGHPDLLAEAALMSRDMPGMLCRHMQYHQCWGLALLQQPWASQHASNTSRDACRLCCRLQTGAQRNAVGQFPLCRQDTWLLACCVAAAGLHEITVSKNVSLCWLWTRRQWDTIGNATDCMCSFKWVHAGCYAVGRSRLAGDHTRTARQPVV